MSTQEGAASATDTYGYTKASGMSKTEKSNATPSLEIDIDKILGDDPNPQPQQHHEYPRPAVPPTTIVAAHDDQTVSTLGHSLYPRDMPPLNMYRPSFNPDIMEEEEALTPPNHNGFKEKGNSSNLADWELKSPSETVPDTSLVNENTGNNWANDRDFQKMLLVVAILILAIVVGVAAWLIASAAEESNNDKSALVPPTLSATTYPTYVGEDGFNSRTKAPTIAPSLRPTQRQDDVTTPNPLPTAPEAPPTQSPSSSPSASPTQELSIEQQNARATLLAVLSAVSATDNLGDNTPQSKALQWLVRDPNFTQYSDERLLQRWVLATFALGGSNNIENWLEYTDECTWFYTNEARLCYREGTENAGLYQRLDLRSQNIEGTIPTEIALLSNHLRFIVLPGNQLTGTLPTELALLTKLERLDLTDNSIGGTLPPEIGGGLSETLVFLGLGRNSLSGSLPSDLGKLTILRTVGLERNQFTSRIPIQMGNMIEARLLNLDYNQLTGTVPNSFRQLTRLEGLNLSFNDGLVGSIPAELCSQALDYLEADCSNVVCECCTTCN